MPHSEPVDGFRLAFDRSGAGEPVVLAESADGYHRLRRRARVGKRRAEYSLVFP